MSLFKKANRKQFKQRSRADSDDDDNEPQLINLEEKKEENEQIINLVEKSIKTKLPNEKTSKNVKLSFVDDGEETEEFKIKRSNSSLKALKQLERKRKDLKKLVKSQNELINQTTKSVRKLMETNKESLEGENLKKQEKRVINFDEIEIDEEENEDYLRFKKPTLTNSIPDNKTIELLKRKRFLAKEQQDFISLNTRDDFATDQNFENSNSRLIREEPNDKETICIDDDEENIDLDDDRVNFYVDKTNSQKERIKEAIFNAQNEAELIEEEDNRKRSKYDNEFLRDDSSNDFDMWEFAQISKGVGLLQQQKDLRTDDFGSYLINNPINQTRNPYEPPSFIKLIKPALNKNQLLRKYKEKLEEVSKELETLHNNLKHIELTIDNIKETLEDKND